MPEVNSFKLLYTFLQAKARSPLKQVTFWVYLLIAILIVGGLGIIIAIVHSDKKEISASLYMYFLAVSSSCGFELTLSKENPSYVKSVSIGLLIILLGFAAWIASHSSDSFSIVLGSVGCLLALAFWWVTNADNPVLRDDQQPGGGSIGPAAQTNLQGNTTGFQT